ncbi:Sugar transferase involved in LPS biosynthesis (colanic, teichoic acid) [Butyrivibrio fibrisolvens DSM 3071]|uniref:Sugar transferase involved in LPS biosynthesis (Colanic, teichoic acid) n=2 Tax=Butyrivibrio fibrisolvens TaxID=831 RepID=A0A1M5XVD8_BUTFI|nr:Sugar transferase involved in LPS biosynthesis (colanic, teichoic acid) [Butyrivibrio fibrisolvens DSM 3071]
MSMKKNSFYSKYVKRFLDILISLMVIVLLCWLYAILALLVRTKLGSPVLFKQDRPGYKGKVFKLYKFRTMTDEKDANGNLLPDEIRLTKFGKWLRSTSLDEIPEFLNILKGDMSFIGPRPLLVQYLPLYSPEQARRHDVRPGLTGYAQAHGRNAISWAKKFELDVWYVDNISFGTDVKIIIDTIKTVVKKEGISSATSATMEPFNGHN